MDAAFIWNLSKLGRIGSRRLQFDDDFADRLNYQYTSVMLFMFIGLIGVRQYVGKPIQCWIPQEFTRGWEEYAENYCWVANTYFAPVQDRLPPVPDRRELLLVYYQWAPIVMAAQALLFYLPCLTWRLGMARSGFNLHRILQMAADANEMVPEAASKTVDVLAHYIRSCIQRQKSHRQTTQSLSGVYSRQRSGQSWRKYERSVKSKRPSKLAVKDESHVTSGAQRASIGVQQTSTSSMNQQRGSKPTTVLMGSTNGSSQAVPQVPRKYCADADRSCNQKKPSVSIRWPQCGRTQGNYLVLLYITIKICYLLNVVGQIYLMQSFIGTKYTSYGARVLLDLVQGREWHQSGHFPRVTFCDLEAKKLGKNHIYTLQCVLPLNMFLEKIYIFLWFWHVTISLITLGSLLIWLYRLFSPHSRERLIRHYLRSIQLNDGSKRQVHDFINQYLCLDGLFIIRLISTNCGGILASDLVGELWLSYRDPDYLTKQKLPGHAAFDTCFPHEFAPHIESSRSRRGVRLMEMFSQHSFLGNRQKFPPTLTSQQRYRSVSNHLTRCFLPECFHTFRNSFVDPMPQTSTSTFNGNSHDHTHECVPPEGTLTKSNELVLDVGQSAISDDVV